jgi:hypothetical protein
LRIIKTFLTVSLNTLSCIWPLGLKKVRLNATMDEAPTFAIFATLRQAFRQKLDWDMRRIRTLIDLMIAFVSKKSTHFQQLAQAFGPKSINTNLRRIVEFFKKFEFFQWEIAELILLSIPEQQVLLILDRTEWKFGDRWNNLLVLGVVVGKICIPIFVKDLDKHGSSSAAECIEILSRLNKVRGSKDFVLLGDREFANNNLIDFLQREEIGFVLRCKANVLAERNNIVEPARFSFDKIGHQVAQWVNDAKIFGANVSLAATTTVDGEYVFVIATTQGSHALSTYRKRWKIECLFSMLKTKGFNLENSHLKDPRALERLVLILGLAVLWSYRAGEFIIKKEKKRAKPKNHGYPQYSIFRNGLDLIRRAVQPKTQESSLLGEVLLLMIVPAPKSRPEQGKIPRLARKFCSLVC